MGFLLGFLLSIIAVFLILLVLVQRGRGGGLTGALGGMGGSSAFGAKAGDVFTRITIVTAAIWIVVCLVAVYWAAGRGNQLSAGDGVLGADIPMGGADAGLPETETPPSEPAGETPRAKSPVGETEQPGAETPRAEAPVGDTEQPAAENGESDQ